MMTFDDTLDIIVVNGDKPFGGAPTNIRIDVMTPDRY
jgi:hypothetical protein